MIGDNHRGVAGIVGGHHCEQLAVVLRRVDRHGELAVCTHFHGAYDVVVRVTHGDGGAGFCRTGHRRACRVEQQVIGLHWRREVWRVHLQGRRRVAGGVLGDDGQDLTVDLRVVQVEDKGAVRIDRHLAQQVAVVVDHGNPGAGFGGTDHLGATVVDGGDHGSRWGDIHGRDSADRRYVGLAVGQGYLQHLAVELRRIKLDDKGAIGAHCAGTDLRGTDIDAHRGPCFADTAQLIACCIEPQLGCCSWRREVGRLHVDRQADVAGWVGL
ncbi:hypothetical protein D3C76_895200 [compost metagenome]